MAQDNDLPPDYWKPTEEDLIRIKLPTFFAIDSHLGGSAEEARGLAWLASREKLVESCNKLADECIDYHDENNLTWKESISKYLFKALTEIK